jgi:hypothetical protein
VQILGISVLAAGLLVGCAPAHVVTTPAPVPGVGELIRFADVADSTEFIVGRLVSVDLNQLVVQRFVRPSLVRPEISSPGEWVRDSISTDSIARLQVRVGRRGNGIRGAIIGALAGATIGVICATEPEGLGTPSGEACFLGYTLFGTGTGWLIGSLRRSDVWAPAPLPDRPQAPGIAAHENTAGP